MCRIWARGSRDNAAGVIRARGCLALTTSSVICRGVRVAGPTVTTTTRGESGSSTVTTPDPSLLIWAPSRLMSGFFVMAMK